MNPRTALLELASIDPHLSGAVAQFELENGTDLPTAGLGELGSTTAEILLSLAEETKATLFALVETLLSSDDELTKTAVTTGFLEAFVSSCETHEIDRSLVYANFGPLASDFVTEWDKFHAVEPPAP